MKLRVSVSGLAALALAAGASMAQAPPAQPKPGPEHQKLGIYLGRWKGSGEMKPGPFGPGGPMTWTERCEWLPGGFHVVCKSKGEGPAGPLQGLAIHGYDAEEKVYTFYGVDSTGWADAARGTVDGKVWTYTSSGKVGGKPYHGRLELTVISERKLGFVWKLSEDGTNWVEMMRGESTK